MGRSGVAFVWVVLALALIGCSPTPQVSLPANADQAGQVGLRLQLSPGVTFSTIDWTIQNAQLLAADRQGVVDVSHSHAIEFVVGGLPAGAGYSITVTGTTDGLSPLTCIGRATFGVVANAQGAVTLNIVCSAGPVDAGNSGSVLVTGTQVLEQTCAAVTSLSAFPSRVDVGGSLTLVVRGVDGSGSSNSVNFSWAVTGGTGTGSLSSTTSASPTFTCASAGTVLVTATASVSDSGSCDPTIDTATVTITCDAADAGAVPGAATVSAGDYFACAVTVDGGVKCWGNNIDGQLGNNSSADSLVPVQVTGLTSGVTAVSTSVAGGATACAITAGGGVECWGFIGSGGVAGITPTSNHSVPVQITGLTSGVTAVSVGSGSACAVTASGGIECWGDNSGGLFGSNSNTSFSVPVPVAGLTSGVTAVSMSASSACAITAGGGVVCWGYGGNGQLGNNTTGAGSVPVQVTGLTSGVTAVSMGVFSACAVTAGGGVQCWGDNSLGELGNNSTANSSVPVQVTGLTSGVTAVSVGLHSACAVTSGGGLVCWGGNTYGELGNDSKASSSVPMQVTGLMSGVTAVSVAFFSACAGIAGGGVKCWGWNVFGELGNNSVTDSAVPVPVTGF